MKHIIAGLLFASLGCLAHAQIPDGVWVRPGYKLELAAEVPNARFMRVAPGNTLYVSLPSAKKIVTLRAGGDGRYAPVADFVTDLTQVHGMDFVDGELWYTQPEAIWRAADANNDGKADQPVKVLDKTTLDVGSDGHWWRSILIHKGRIYTSVGDSGNITDQTSSKRQKIWTYDLQGKDERQFCSGLRNTEKLVVRPGTDEIWGMDHGSDEFGAVMEEKAKKGKPITSHHPPCEMNKYEQGKFYGHPFITGDRLPRYEFMNRTDIVDLAARTTPPMWCCGAHWAPNAMEFYDADQFPETRGDAFVAYHGSWNREDADGYCVTRVYLEDGKPWGERRYVDFQAADGRVLGRPVDIAVEADGSLLISDDLTGRIYRLRHAGSAH